MTITFERQHLIKKLLDPISKVADSCSLELLPDKIQTVVASQDGGIILYSQFMLQNSGITDPINVNLSSVRKLIQVLECIEEQFVDLKIESNHLAYDSPGIKFKYFLLDDGVVEKSPLKTEKIEALKFQSGFKLGSNELNELIKGSSFTAETNKVYVFPKDKAVFAELTDHSIQNTNSLTFKMSNAFAGTKFEQIPLSMDIVRLLGSLKTSSVVKINTELKVLMFEISDTYHTLKFIVSPLVK